MAGGFAFSGAPLGSFSGRGADFQPMQFILEQRRLASQAEQQRKQQAAAQQQSFVMALMAKKQQEAERAQKAIEAQAKQAFDRSEQERLREQFRAEQQRLRDSEKSKLQSEYDQRAWVDAKAKTAEAERRGLEAKTENRRALGMNVRTATVRGLEQRFQQFSAIPGSDPIQALDAIEAQALEETSAIDDPEAQAMAVAEIRAWRADKESQLGRRESLGSMIEERKSRTEDRAEGRRLQSEAEARRVEEGKAKQAQAKSRARQNIIQGPGGLLERAYDALALARTAEDKKAAQEKIDKLEAELEELALQTVGS